MSLGALETNGKKEANHICCNIELSSLASLRLCIGTCILQCAFFKVIGKIQT